MIQRIQSIYLLIVSILMLFMLVSKIAEIAVERDESAGIESAAGEQETAVVEYKNYGAKLYLDDKGKMLVSTFPITILTVITGLVSFMNIFLYSSRIRQIRLCIFNILLLLGLSGLIYYYFTFIKKQILGNGFIIADHAFKIAAIFPVLSIILTYLAFRAIRRDELLVRSYERLRK
jgi:hypothetical protein